VAVYTVNQLAKLAGVSVRTLHHYEEIGLLAPSERTRSGHRLYGPADVERLQKIVGLRQLGVPLENDFPAVQRWVERVRGLPMFVHHYG